VKQALATWQQIASLPQAQLVHPHNDWTEIIGPMPLARYNIASTLNSNRPIGSFGPAAQGVLPAALVPLPCGTSAAS